MKFKRYHYIPYIIGALLGMFFAVKPLHAEFQIIDEQKKEYVEKYLFEQKYPTGQELFSGKKGDYASLESVLSLDLNLNSDSISVWHLYALALIQLSQDTSSRQYFDILEKNIESSMVKQWVFGLELAHFASLAQFRDRQELLFARVEKLMLRQGYLRVPEFTSVLLRETRIHIDKNDLAEAERYLKWAAEFDSYCPWVYPIKLEILFRAKTPFAWNMTQIWEDIRACLHIVSSAEVKAAFMANSLEYISALLSGFSIVYVLILFLKHFTRIFHQLYEWLPEKKKYLQKYLTIAMVVVTIPVVGMGSHVCLLLMIFLVWKHCKSRERLMFKAILVWMAVLPVLMYASQNLKHHLSPNHISNLYFQTYQNGYNFQLHKKLQKFQVQDGQEKMIKLVSLSIIHKKKGEYTSARAYAEKALAVDPLSPIALSNLGNLHFIYSNFNEAREIYLKALAVNPNSPEVLFNMSQTELFLNQSLESGQYLEKAMDKGPDYISKFVEQNDRNFTSEASSSNHWPILRKVMDLPIQSKPEWDKLLKFYKDPGFWSMAYRDNSLDIPPAYMTLAILILIVMIQINKNNGFKIVLGTQAFVCKLCGHIICHVCRSGAHCSDCARKTEGLKDAKVKAELERQIVVGKNQNKLWVMSGLNAVLPGMGYAYIRFSFKNLTLIFFSLMLWLGYYYLINLTKAYPNYVIGPYIHYMLLPLVPFYIGFIITLLIRIFRKKASSYLSNENFYEN